MKTNSDTPTPLDGTVRPLRMLIADDSALLLSCLRDLLAVHKHLEVVGTATNGSEALRKAAELKPDLVLMDLNMPIMDGLMATDELRHRQPNVRIIIMTMEEPIHAKAAAHAYGAHGFIQKELIVGDLIREIHRVFHLC